MKHPVVVVLMLALAALACNVPESVEPLPTGEAAQATEALSVTDADATDEVAEPTNIPTTDAPPTATDGPPDGVCVEPGGIPVPNPLPGTEALPDSLASYLTAGGSVTALRQAMRDAGRITEENGLIDDTLDFNADGIDDVLVTYVRTEVEPFGLLPPGVLVLYLCDEGVYQPIVEHNVTGEDVDTTFIPQVIAARDLNGEAGAEVLFYDGNCGAHTCFNTLRGYMTDGEGGAESLFVENFNGPYPDFAFEERDSDQATEIVVQGGAIGSVGAGPQRTFRYIYDWNGSAYTQTDVEQTSPSHPIHVVMDADDLLMAGDYDAALAEYERSYTDDSLNLFGGAESWPLDELEAYSRYRRVLLHLVQGDRGAAQAENIALQEQFPGTQGADFAQTLLDSYEAEGERIEPACEAVVASIPDDWQATTPLNEFGYANTYYEPVDMCPFGST